MDKVINMHKLGHKKKFGGKYYTAMAHFNNKAKANSEARFARKLGHNARVIKQDKEYYLYINL